MKIPTLIFITVLITFGCRPKEDVIEKIDYEIILDDGIYVEQFDTTNVSENRYTANNSTYLEGNKLIYDYYYQALDGEKFKFEEIEGASELDFRERTKAWRLVNIKNLTERTIDKVELEVNYGLEPMSDNNPDYNQTVISYKYPQVNGDRQFSSSTGVIENEKNIWAHPPRDKLFRILEINPFPFIQAPYEIGNKWEWSLVIGSFWGDNRWKTWDESIENQYSYEITDKLKVTTAIGEMECYEIKSMATSLIGETYLTSYFNMDIGFVKLDYTNVDSTKTVLEVVGFEKGNTETTM